MPIFIGCTRDVDLLEAELAAAAAAVEGQIEVESITGGLALIAERMVWISDDTQQFIHSEDMVHWQQYMFTRLGEEV